jgi:hypothetical protein
MKQLDETRHGLAYGSHIPLVQMTAQVVVAFHDVRVAGLAQPAPHLGGIVHHEAIVRRKILGSHLVHLPAGQVEVYAVNESQVLHLL